MDMKKPRKDEPSEAINGGLWGVNCVTYIRTDGVNRLSDTKRLCNKPSKMRGNHHQCMILYQRWGVIHECDNYQRWGVIIIEA